MSWGTLNGTVEMGMRYVGVNDEIATTQLDCHGLKGPEAHSHRVIKPNDLYNIDLIFLEMGSLSRGSKPPVYPCCGVNQASSVPLLRNTAQVLA